MKYCDRCPVLAECDQDARPEDRKYLVLGGRMPLAIQGGHNRKTAGNSSPVLKLADTPFKKRWCRGEVKHYIQSYDDLALHGEVLKCLACSRIASEKSSEKKKVKRAALKAARDTMTA